MLKLILFFPARPRDSEDTNVIIEEPPKILPVTVIVSMIIVVLALIAIALFIYYYNKVLKDKLRMFNASRSFFSDTTALSSIQEEEGNKSEEPPSSDEHANSVDEMDITESSIQKTKSDEGINDEQGKKSETQQPKQPKQTIQDSLKQNDEPSIPGRDTKSLLSVSSATTPLMQKRSKGKMIKEVSSQQLASAPVPSESKTSPSSITTNKSAKSLSPTKSNTRGKRTK